MRDQLHGSLSLDVQKRVVIVGAGWAGLGAAYHLAQQGYDVTLLEAGPYPGGLVAGWKTPDGQSVEAGIHGFWYPYKNIFGLVKRLGLDPFTPWTRSQQFSPAGLEAESPIFQDLPRLPMPLGTFAYPKFPRLPLVDRLSAFPLLHAVVDFDNSPEAWAKYDKMSAKELFNRYGVSERLYRDAFEAMLLVGLFAPGEQCSAAAALGMLYYFILAHQPDFDVVWCRGTVGEKIFQPWCDRIQSLGGKILTRKKVTDVRLNQQGEIDGVLCGSECFDCDAAIFAVGITGLQKIIQGSQVLPQFKAFRNMMNLKAIDILATRLWFDRQISIPQPSNACFGFQATTGWTFFDLNALHDDYRQAPGSVIEVDFYHANQYLPMTDEAIVQMVQRDLAQCIPEFSAASVTHANVVRLPNAVTHFFPGSYQYLQPAQSPVNNLLMSGDWVITQHGSWSQEKAYVTGLEAANLVIQKLDQGQPAEIIPIEPDEPHIQFLRSLNHGLTRFLSV